MHLSTDPRRAFGWWLRTGRLMPVRSADGVELKFNPYHDPDNGQFTFGPGGAGGGAMTARGGVRLLGEPPEPVIRRGGNARAFEDAMTLERTFPGLKHAPGGAIIAVANNLLDLWGPANEMQAELLQNWTRQAIADIKALDPRWRPDSLGIPAMPTTIDGMTYQLNNLRWQRAVIIARVQGDYRPLQVETLRFVQRRANMAYDEGQALLRVGKLPTRLSEREALGNYVDRRVRLDLRLRYRSYGIDEAAGGVVRVNRRENDSSGNDLTYRRPDARVGDVAFDVTLAHKTLRTPQVQGFFNTDFRPNAVIIIRPTQIDGNSTYIISRPGAHR